MLMQSVFLLLISQEEHSRKASASIHPTTRFCEVSYYWYIMSQTG